MLKKNGERSKMKNSDVTEICYWLATYFLLLGLWNCFFENQHWRMKKKIGYFPIYHPPEIIRAIVAVSAIMGPRRKMCINPGYCF